ncbi:hypothetical protein U1872_03595 [Sphingomonas sp. RB3P16]|uniref:hypothetical protein n=1 Tax=Parasphingomonas frigoris TaxID=3096163 RepID=UPI002FC7F18B
MDMTALQDRIVTEIARGAPVAQWERIVADVEIAEADDGYQFDTVAFAVTRDADGELSDPQFSLSAEAQAAIVALYTQRKAAGDVLGGFELQIDYPGRYGFTFSYDSPKRLNGIWDKAKEERLDHYLDAYKRETKAG